MTNITADYFRNTKIKILSPEHSKQVQEAVFSVGGGWTVDAKTVKLLDESYLFIDEYLDISYSSIEETFDTCTEREITFPPKEEENVMTIDYEQYVGKTLEVVKDGWGLSKEFVGVEFKITGYDPNGYFGEEGFTMQGYRDGGTFNYVSVKSFDLTQPEKWKPVAGEEVFVRIDNSGRKFKTHFVGYTSKGGGAFEITKEMVGYEPEEVGDVDVYDAPLLHNFSPIPKTKLIHGVEVPDISFVPKEGERSVVPDPLTAALFYSVYSTGSDSYKHRVQNNLHYPNTEEGKQAAILHAKAMLGIADK